MFVLGGTVLGCPLKVSNFDRYLFILQGISLIALGMLKGNCVTLVILMASDPILRQQVLNFSGFQEK